jgi:hypothetical protein
MAKITGVIEKSYTRDGKEIPLWETSVEKSDGTKINATSFEPVKLGDEFPDDRIHRNKKDDGWVIWSEKKVGGKQWQPKDDSIIIAECAAKLVVQLVIAGKINPVKLADYQENFISFAKAIKSTAAAIKDPAAKAEPAKNEKPAEKTGGITNMGQLRKAVSTKYPTLNTTGSQDKIWGDPKAITDFDAAFKKVVDYMEKPII